MPVTISLDQLVARAGSEVAVSEWLDITQPMIDEFADAIHDRQWIHVDPERAARESPFRDAAGQRRTVAHGFLTLSLLTRMLENAIDVSDRQTGINVGFNKVRFTGPVTSGSRVRGRFALADVKPVAGGVQLTWNVTVECESTGKPVLVAEWLTRILTG
ncbi:MAG TPA: MaoC family dehydratase [Gemmatimonadaceae bacterium]|nr:MaoC family dehydratase [Gemmatimonadaceae bacterium]